MKIREYLFYNGIQQKDLAALLGCHPKYLCQVISGKYMPSPKFAKKIREITGVEIEASTATLIGRKKKSA